MPSLSTLALLALIVLALPASAQSTEADTVAVAADSTQVAADSLVTPHLGGLLRRVAADMAEAQAETPVPGPIPPPAPILHVFGSGLRVTLPPGWDGPAIASEGDPGHATYAFQNTATGHPLVGASVRLERVSGLNPLLRERWLRGQTTHGYNGTRPVGPATAPIPGFAVEVEGPGLRGIAVFTQRDDGLWALQVVAPTALWEQRRDEVRALLAGIRLP